MNLLAMRWRLGGRGEDGTIDCYGVTRCKAAELGRPIGDCWDQVQRQWADGDIDAVTALPPEWLRVDAALAQIAPQTGDIWVVDGERPGVGIIDGGWLWTATRSAGVVLLDPRRQSQPREVWRFSGRPSC